MQESTETRTISEFRTPRGNIAKCANMTQDETKMLFTCIVADQEERRAELTIPDQKEWPPLSQIVQKRIEVFQLPLQFTWPAILAINALTDVPGGAVALLIDCLNKFDGVENKVVTVEDLCEMYPWGFYTEDSLREYIDNELKPRKIKWAEVYVSTK